MKNLIKAVKEIDPEAAEYLEKEVMPRYNLDRIEKFEKNSNMQDLVESVLLWETSPQGNLFWKEIWTKLGENGNSNN